LHFPWLFEQTVYRLLSNENVEIRELGESSCFVLSGYTYRILHSGTCLRWTSPLSLRSMKQWGPTVARGCSWRYC